MITKLQMRLRLIMQARVPAQLPQPSSKSLSSSSEEWVGNGLDPVGAS